jgi:hypothetical protein
MSEETELEKKGFFHLVGDLLKGLSLKVKLIFGAIIGIFSFILVFVVQKRMNARQILELELEKIRTELEIEMVQKDIDFNQEKINALELREDEIRGQLKELDELEPRESVTNEELDEFFDDRGF